MVDMAGAATATEEKALLYMYWAQEATGNAVPLPVPCKIDPTTNGNGNGSPPPLGSVWNQKKVGFIDSKSPSAKAAPAAFMAAAKKACQLDVKKAQVAFPNVDDMDVPYLCMDLTYQYTLLVDGFGLQSMKKITFVDKVKHGEYYIEAAWPLGSAIEAVTHKEKPGN